MFRSEVVSPANPPRTDDPFHVLEGYDDLAARMGDIATALRGDSMEEGPPKLGREHAADSRFDPKRRTGRLRCLEKCTRR
jgi:hypothetical protein